METKCKVQECDEGHSFHYCKICSNSNSSHLARDCPSGKILYHGTKVSYITSIIKNGLTPSTTGTIGPGIYFAEEHVASAVSNLRGSGTGTAVIKCRVNVAYCKTNEHPPWAGVGSFTEWCLTDANKYRIIGIQLVDGIIDGDIHLPRGDIIVSGQCQFKGSVTAGNFIVNGGHLTFGY